MQIYKLITKQPLLRQRFGVDGSALTEIEPVVILLHVQLTLD